MQALKLTQIGNSLGSVFPKDVVAHLNVEKGDALFVTKLPSGGITLTPYDPSIEEELDAGRAFMKEYRDTFRVLAK
jgi:putative addiction module antidote